jgi:hypothetical protein
MADSGKLAKQDQRKTSPDPQSTWGATEQAKADWEAQRGDTVRRATQRANEEAETA